MTLPISAMEVAPISAIKAVTALDNSASVMGWGR